MPTPAAGATPASLTARATRDGRAAPRRRRRVTTAAASAPTIRTEPAMTTAPPRSVSESKWIPGSGSASRPTPIGNADDTSHARATPSTAPPTAIGATCAVVAAHHCRRAKPSAWSVTWSSTSSAVRRASANTIATVPAMAATAARIHSAAVVTSIALCAPWPSTPSPSAPNCGSSRKMRRIASLTNAASSSPFAVRTRSTVPPGNAPISRYLSMKARVGTITPPVSPRAPRSSGLRTIPTTRSVGVGPCGSNLDVPSCSSMSCCVNDWNRTRSPTRRCMRFARPGPMSSSSAPRARRPSTRSGRSMV